MKKLTKKQHRAEIKRIIDNIQCVHDMRCVQIVAEIFEEDEKIREDGSVSNLADSIRLVLDLFERDRAAEVYGILYDYLEDVKEGLNGDNIYTEIDDMLHELGVPDVLIIRSFVKSMLRNKKPSHN